MRVVYIVRRRDLVSIAVATSKTRRTFQVTRPTTEFPPRRKPLEHPKSAREICRSSKGTSERTSDLFETTSARRQVNSRYTTKYSRYSVRWQPRASERAVTIAAWNADKALCLSVCVCVRNISPSALDTHPMRCVSVSRCASIRVSYFSVFTTAYARAARARNYAFSLPLSLPLALSTYFSSFFLSFPTTTTRRRRYLLLNRAAATPRDIHFPPLPALPAPFDSRPVVHWVRNARAEPRPGYSRLSRNAFALRKCARLIMTSAPAIASIYVSGSFTRAPVRPFDSIVRFCLLSLSFLCRKHDSSKDMINLLQRPAAGNRAFLIAYVQRSPVSLFPSSYLSVYSSFALASACLSSVETEHDVVARSRNIPRESTRAVAGCIQQAQEGEGGRTRRRG